MRNLLKFSWIVITLSAQVVAAFAADHDLDALMQAILESETDQVQSILGDSSHPIDFDAMSTSDVTKGWTPLALAAAKGDVRSVELLLASGARLDRSIQFNNQTVSPFVLAAMYDRSEVMKLILNSPGFGSDGYRREMILAQRLQQPSLFEHLRAASDSEIRGKEVTAILRGSSAPADGTCHYEALTQFPGDLVAQMQDDVCLICLGVPGSNGSSELLNGHKRTADHETVGCCGARFCKKCTQAYRQNTGRNVPQCPACRAPGPNYVEFKNAIAALSWSGSRITIPASVVLGAAVVPAQAAPTSQLAQVAAANGIPTVLPDHPRFNQLSQQFRNLGNMYEVAGLIWSGVLASRQLRQRDAVAYCAGLGGGSRLPTKDEYIALARAMGSRQPDYHAPGFDSAGYDKSLIPDLINRNFWTASVDPQYDDRAFNFIGSEGYIYHDNRGSIESVRCVVGG